MSRFFLFAGIQAFSLVFNVFTVILLSIRVGLNRHLVRYAVVNAVFITVNTRQYGMAKPTYGASSSALSVRLSMSYKEAGVFHGIENADDLPEHLEALWTYAAGHAGVAADGLPDGWLRYEVPSSDTNMAHWPVHPAWFALQAAYCSKVAQEIDTTTGEQGFWPLNVFAHLEWDAPPHCRE